MAPSFTLSNRFTEIVEGMCRAVAAHFDESDAVIRLIWYYLDRKIRRFAALANLVGPFPPPVPRVRSPSRAPQPSDPSAAAAADPPQPRPKRPRGFGWLYRTLEFTGPSCEQLRELIAAPEMAALLAISPQARSLIRPLCRMIGLHPLPETLRYPPSPATPSQPKTANIFPHDRPPPDPDGPRWNLPWPIPLHSDADPPAEIIA